MEVVDDEGECVRRNKRRWKTAENNVIFEMMREEEEEAEYLKTRLREIEEDLEGKKRRERV